MPSITSHFNKTSSVICNLCIRCIFQNLPNFISRHNENVCVCILHLSHQDSLSLNQAHARQTKYEGRVKHQCPRKLLNGTESYSKNTFKTSFTQDPQPPTDIFRHHFQCSYKSSERSENKFPPREDNQLPSLLSSQVSELKFLNRLLKDKSCISLILSETIPVSNSL